MRESEREYNRKAFFWRIVEEMGLEGRCQEVALAQRKTTPSEAGVEEEEGGNYVRGLRKVDHVLSNKGKRVGDTTGGQRGEKGLEQLLRKVRESIREE